MGSRFRPVYVDGPLLGEDFPTNLMYVQAVDYGEPGISSFTAGSLIGNVVTYQLRQFGFHAGGKAVSFWVGSCSPGEPDAVTVFRALCKPELFDRAELLDMPETERT